MRFRLGTGLCLVEMIITLVLEELAVRWLLENHVWMISMSDCNSAKSDGAETGLKRVVSSA